MICFKREIKLINCHKFHGCFYTIIGTNQHVVLPLLIYADMIAGQSDRNIETAKIIYEIHVSY